MRGRVIGALLHDVILIVGAVVLSRNRLSSFMAIALALPAIALQYGDIMLGAPALSAGSAMFAILFYLLTLFYLLRYVFSARAISADKLFGAAAAYLMLGVMWYSAYTIVQFFYPRSFAVHGTPVDALSRLEMVYFSFTVFTSTGFGDIVPVSAPARSLANLESICGILFVAILIARLVGAYPDARDKEA